MHKDGLFSGDLENVVRWVNTAGVVLTAVAIVLLLFVLRRKPTGRTTLFAKRAFFTDLFLLPPTTMLLGNVVGFQKDRLSCGNGHTMDPWIQDMKNPDSQTLAAKHYRNRWIDEDPCCTCHTGYGLSGNFEAKKGRVSHVMHCYSSESRKRSGSRSRSRSRPACIATDRPRASGRSSRTRTPK